jgi:hypothetical protein
MHALTGVRTRDPSNQAALDRDAPGIDTLQSPVYSHLQ